MPDKTQTPDLEAVLTRLESSWQELLQTLRRGSPTRDKTVAAEKLVLVDARGETRGILGVNDDGSSGLVLMDRDGKYRAWLGLKEDGSAYLSLKDHLGRISFEAPPTSRSPRPPEVAAPGPESPEAPDTGESQAVLARLEKVGQDLAGLKESVARQGHAVPPDQEQVEAAMRRLEGLERQNRGLKWAGGVIAALLLLTMAGLGFLLHRAQPGGGPLTTQTLVITDPAGAPRAWLGARQGAVQLELYDQAGQVRTTLGVGSKGDPGLFMYDGVRKPRAELALTPEGEPGLSLVDADGLLRVALGKINPKYPVPAYTLERPVSSLVLFNKDGNPVWNAPLRWRP